MEKRLYIQPNTEVVLLKTERIMGNLADTSSHIGGGKTEAPERRVKAF